MVVCFTAVRKNVVLFAMSMQVETTYDFLLGGQPPDFFFDGHKVRVQ